MNRLISESSPYLLQHAHNPVQWYPWGQEALEKAVRENKPILVSIGYSACHWCHVMERECFEQAAIAEVMNRYLVCIKVDREERPDIDAIYMDAVHLMGVRGGWPLNVFLLPNAKPFYGVTYLPAANWTHLVKSIHTAFNEHYDELAKSAEGFAEGLQLSEVEKYGLQTTSSPWSVQAVDHMFERLKAQFDVRDGGMDRAPKFPMPSIYKFLLRYFDLSQNPEALAQIELTLNRMALGGIYDHVGGGWARYSVDGEWFIPHFEKMLYDNAQLLGVYSEAYSLTHNPLYADRIRQTFGWLKASMQDQSGGFYSALDADSEGVEGKFYVWTADELKAVLGEDYSWFSTLYSITENGNWEHGLNHLHLTQSVEIIAKNRGLDTENLAEKYSSALTKLLVHRQARISPGLDDKILASWNGLLLRGLVDAYRALGDEEIKSTALALASFLRDNMVGPSTALYHSFKAGTATINGFLEDYASVAEGFAALYQITFDPEWVRWSERVLEAAVANFYDPADGFFYFTQAGAEPLIARKKELLDNVIPASNSILAHALFQAGMLLDRTDFVEMADAMLNKMTRLLASDIQVATHWAAYYALRTTPTAEVVIIGPECEKFRKDFDRFFIPNKIMLGSTQASDDLPLLSNRTAIDGKTTIYVCFDKTCQLPVFSVKEALELLA